MGVAVREKVKGSGVFWVFINHKGNRTSQCVGSHHAAKTVAKKLESMIALETFKVPAPEPVDEPTLKVYSATWLAGHIEGVLDDTTHERYGEVMTRDITSTLGHLPLDQIEPKHVNDLLNKLAKDGRTSKSIALTRTVLSTCLNDAVIDGHITSNPVKVLTQTHKRNKTREARRVKVHKINPLTAEEVKKFISFVMADDPEVYGPMFFTGLRTGLRLGELIALHWDDIDFDAKVINVRRSFKRQQIKPPKNGKERAVDMSPQLMAMLANLLKARQLAAAQNGGGEPSNIIFGIDGGYRAQNTVRKAFKTYLEKAGMRTIRVHDMRHTYATLLIIKGVTLAYIQAQLGHSSIKITVDIYGHLEPGCMNNVVHQLDDTVDAMN